MAKIELAETLLSIVLTNQFGGEYSQFETSPVEVISFYWTATKIKISLIVGSERLNL